MLPTTESGLILALLNTPSDPSWLMVLQNRINEKVEAAEGLRQEEAQLTAKGIDLQTY